MNQLHFEEALTDDWSGDYDVQEVALDEKPLFYSGLAILFLALIIVGRILFLGFAQAQIYTERADTNLGRYERVAAPRGIITDRFGEVLAENKPVFSAYLDVQQFLKDHSLEESTIKAANELLGISSDEFWEIVKSKDLEKSNDPVVLKVDLNQSELVKIKEKNLSTLLVKEGFRREYVDGEVFSSVLGYIGLPTVKDLEKDADLSGQDFIGKTGVEAYYEKELRGQPGVKIKVKDAKGNELDQYEKQVPNIGKTIHLSLDGELQKYAHERMKAALQNLDRTSGAVLAMNPQNGEVLAMLNFPTFDNNIFSSASFGGERVNLLSDPKRPLFNRIVSGLYSPGSTIKPLVGVAALAEKVIDPEKTIFSPGYLDVANPYDPQHPTRFVDWRFQGEVDLGAAIAQSSNVYFYKVGGGTPTQRGLGITRLRNWWQKFNLDKLTGIDLPGESTGFLPSAEWKEKKFNQPWRLGDTYNVSIGQGDLQVTPLALLNYISAIANGGKLLKPHVNLSLEKQTAVDLSSVAWEILEVQKGMKQTVEGQMGTAHIMNDLPFKVGGKTGSAQIQNNRAENAFFVGYAPYDNPKIAILIMVENAKQGSLNAVPVAKEILYWYWLNRLQNKT